MKTRYKKYADYGMSMQDVFKAYDWINNCTDVDKRRIHELLSEQIPPAVAEYVFLALTERKGYWNLYNIGLDYDKADFYGYKRKGLSIVNEQIINPMN